MPGTRNGSDIAEHELPYAAGSSMHHMTGRVRSHRVSGSNTTRNCRHISGREYVVVR